MAKLIDSKTKNSEEVADGEAIRSAAEKLGVPFDCKEGICGVCSIDIVKGEENLSDLTEQEEDMGKDRDHRLSCQCKIESGEVEIRF